MLNLLHRHANQADRLKNKRRPAESHIPHRLQGVVQALWLQTQGEDQQVPTQNRVPSDGEEEPAVWSDLTTSVPSSLEVSAFVDRLNEKCSVPVDTPPCSLEHPTIGETLAILEEMED